MTDLHEKFREWLLAGAPGEPPRDAALHASACDRCLADVAAVDALLAVEVAGAELPIIPVGEPKPMLGPGTRAVRTISGAAAVGLLVLAAMIGAGSLREDSAGPGAAMNPTESPGGEGILAGAPSLTPAASAIAATPSPSASATESAVPSEDPLASDVATAAAPTQPPFVAPPPPAIPPGPTTAATPQPTTAVTPLPTAQPTPAPTAVPTTPATPEPTPEPTAEPTPIPTAEPPPPSPSEDPAP